MLPLNHLRKASRTAPGFCWLSAPGASALALLFVRGNGDVFGGALRNADLTPRLVWLRDSDGQRLDQAMCARQGDGVLITCHGGPGVREALEHELRAHGLNPLSPHGLNLHAADNRFRRETLGLLPHVMGESGARWVLEAAEQSDALRRVLEDPGRLPGVLSESRALRWLFEPPRVQLWGPVNAGKSSLLNALCGRSLAATGDEPGLTRDVIEGRLHHRGFVIRLFDAPGLGAAGAIDAEAVKLAERWRAEADLTIELTPPGADPTGAGDWCVAARADERGDAPEPSVSIHDDARLLALKDRLVDHFFGRPAALPPGRRFALLPALRVDLQALAEGREDAGRLLKRWLS